MFFRLKRAWHRTRFDHAVSPIFRKAPLLQNSDDVTVVSMVCHGEVGMYLLAVSSFCQYLGSVPRIVILNDGSLTARDRQLLHARIPGAKLVPLAEVTPSPACPKGGCWERLLLISDLSESTYVVQLDSDTLTLNNIPHVAEAIAANRSFTLLGDGSHPEIEPMLSACERYRSNPDNQVQSLCERTFDRLPECASMRYVRGNAGFAGFAKGSLTRAAVEHISNRMRTLAGDHWDEWGSEQLASNLLIANASGASSLPFPQYLSHWARPEVDYDRPSFIHFIGPRRFTHGTYRRSARRVLRTLATKAAA